MSITDLKIDYEMVLPPVLESSRYSTRNVTNQISLQTLEKSFVRYPATSGDVDSQLTFNLPSINGSAMVRELELEVPITFQITFTGIAPDGPVLSSTASPIPLGQAVATFTYGSSPRPFLNELCCLDTFPLSKIFNSRSYTINNSSTIVKEDFTAEQIDIMSAQLDLRKCENSNLCLFADANAHFRTLDATTGGNMIPLAWTDNTNSFNTVTEWVNNLSLIPNASAQAPSYVLNPACRYAAGVCESWQAKRNSARNIVSSTVDFSGVTSGTSVHGYGSNDVPNSNAQPYLLNFAYYGADLVCNFKYVVREQLLSQFWDHEYSHSAFSWNKLLPVSSLNIKLDINSKYLREALLKIGDNVSEIIGSGGKYEVSVPTIGDYSTCYLYARQMKIPQVLLPNESYKILYYEQTKPQASKEVKYNGSGSFEAEMQFANLSQVPEWLLFYMPIKKSSLKGNVTGVSANSNAYQLPSMLNFPITNLQLTFNSDSGLGTHQLDARQLQQYTMENLQDNKDLMDLIVGKSGHITRNAGKVKSYIQNTSGAAIISDVVRNAFIEQNMSQIGSPFAVDCAKTNGISNSSFILLNVSKNLRLPASYCESMIVNFNLTVKATYDSTSQFVKSQKDVINDVAGLTAINPSLVTGSLEVVHFNKRILNLSGDSLQNIYITNVLITSSEYMALSNAFQRSFQNSARHEVFDTKMMLGGGFFSNVKQKTMDAYNWLKPRISKALETGREVVDFAKQNVSQDHALRKYIDMADQGLRRTGHGYDEDPHSISAGGSPHMINAGSYEDPHSISAGKRKPAAKKSLSASEWKKYIDKY
jgi:hypothetical protein